jgi:hypothetical protein
MQREYGLWKIVGPPELCRKYNNAREVYPVKCKCGKLSKKTIYELLKIKPKSGCSSCSAKENKNGNGCKTMKRDAKKLAEELAEYHRKNYERREANRKNRKTNPKITVQSIKTKPSIFGV